MIGSPVLPLPLDPLNGLLTSMFGGGKAPVKWVLKDYSSKKKKQCYIWHAILCVCPLHGNKFHLPVDRDTVPLISLPGNMYIVQQ